MSEKEQVAANADELKKGEREGAEVLKDASEDSSKTDYRAISLTSIIILQICGLASITAWPSFMVAVAYISSCGAIDTSLTIWYVFRGVLLLSMIYPAIWIALYLASWWFFVKKRRHMIALVFSAFPLVLSSVGMTLLLITSIVLFQNTGK